MFGSFGVIHPCCPSFKLLVASRTLEFPIEPSRCFASFELEAKDWSDGMSGDISADAYISQTGYHLGICPTGRPGVRWPMLRTMVNLENRLFEARYLRVRPSYDIHMGRDTLEYGPTYITMWRQRYLEYGPRRTSTWDAILLSMVHRISTCGVCYVLRKQSQGQLGG
ncbi:hypothetical protein OROHE_014410 [Orobanche hederae]